jgi:hypothetical protein
MRSFISGFKPLLIALAIIAATETAVAAFTPALVLFNSNFLELAFQRTENQDKIDLELKKDYMPQVNPYFLQVGDSSGFHGVKAELLKPVFPDKPYLVMSCCANMGYAGHRAIAEAALNQPDNNIHYLIFYVTPFAPPTSFAGQTGQLGDAYASAFVSPWRYLNPPSMAYRLNATNLLYYGHFIHDFRYNPSHLSENYAAKYRDWLLTRRGWAPRAPNNQIAAPSAPVPTGACNFERENGAAPWTAPDQNGKWPIAVLYPELTATARLARAHHVQMLLVFNPVSCDYNPRDEAVLYIEREIARFRADYPEVIVPFEFVHTMPARYFRDPFHLSEEGAEIHTPILADALKRSLSDPAYRGVKPKSPAEIDNLIAHSWDAGLILPETANPSVIPGMGGASGHYTTTPPGNLTDDTPAPWGFAGGEDVYFWIATDGSRTPTRIALMSYLYNNHPTMRDLRLIAGTKRPFRSKTRWHFLRARIHGDKEWSDKITIPRDLPSDWVVVDIDPDDVKGTDYNTFGFACLTATRGDPKNYDKSSVGDVIYVREMALLK